MKHNPDNFDDPVARQVMLLNELQGNARRSLMDLSAALADTNFEAAKEVLEIRSEVEKLRGRLAQVKLMPKSFYTVK